MKKRLLSGIKPTGELTLGNYIGAIRQFVKMESDYETFLFVADMHALTIYNEPEVLHERIRRLIALYIACGLDPNKNTIFLQSENLYHANLSWVLECNSYVGELSRMTQYKEKASNENNNSITCGLFTYPVLMASDILIYDADVIPVGIDQKQHVELARNIAIRFNNRYGTTFKVPTPIIPEEGAKIKDLQNPTKKMSKSDDNEKGYILLLDDIEKARKKIMSSVTDSDNKIKFDEENKPGISNLITIYSSLTDMTIKEVEEKFKDSNYGEFKKEVANVVCELLEKIQTKYNEIINSDLIDKILDEGKKKTTLLAGAKYEAIKNKIGLTR